MPPKKPSVCVFCGSRMGANPAYQDAARAVGNMIAANDWRLVYGAGDVGLMGAVAQSAQDSGAETFGVIPEHLLSREVGKTDLTHLVVTENMHERKKVMFMNSDALVILPGGAGSLDEFFEVLTWRQLGLHNMQIIILNIDGYWNALLQLMGNIVSEGFADPSLLDLAAVVTDCEDLEAALREALT